MTRRFLAIITMIVTMVSGSAAFAQSQYWVQIEAQPTLSEAETAAAGYDAALDRVAGFALAGGWYAIVLGPFSEDEALFERQTLRNLGRIPADSYVTDGLRFESQFWPAAGGTVTPEPEVAEAPAPVAAPEIPEETYREALASEARLTADERRELQIALQWEGLYNSGIDGAFGPGTRAAMREWQAQNGHEANGVLTTRQRAELLQDYRSVMDSLGLQTVFDNVAGIEIRLPLGLIEFGDYAPPFAHYTAKDNSGVQVLLISQTGDSATLGGLYEIMQTLEVVPLDGPRSRSRNSFSLVGRNANFVSETYAVQSNGEVKGFTLIWPTGDEKRREVAMAAMRDSFTPVAGTVLPDTYGDGPANEIDLVAGLEVRRPDLERSGFYVSGSGQVLTVASAVESCARVTLDNLYDAKVTATGNGLALLTPTDALAPSQTASFRIDAPRLQSEVSVAGYSFGGKLNAPTQTYGLVAELAGLNGEADLIRLDIDTTDQDAGGAVIDTTGAVIGVMLADSDGARQLPGAVGFALNKETAVSFLSDNGISAPASDSDAPQTPDDRDRQVAKMTVLVGCWN